MRYWFLITGWAAWALGVLTVAGYFFRLATIAGYGDSIPLETIMDMRLRVDLLLIVGVLVILIGQVSLMASRLTDRVPPNTEGGVTKTSENIRQGSLLR
jgi:hypothetical protein